MTTEPALETIAAAPDLLVALDFDGTVAPLVDDPSQSRATDRAAAAIARLKALPRTWVAFVSGRAFATLAQLTDAGPDDLLIGSHGVEVRIGGELADLGLTADERERMARLESLLEPLVAPVPEAFLEHKPVGMAVHTRRVADQSVVPGLHEAARAAADQVGGFTVRAGKDVLEFSVRDVTKGDGVQALRELLAADAGDAVVSVLYAGDDVTDEDAFGVLGPGDLGVKVGPGETKATARVADIPEFEELLLRLATVREASARRY